MILFNSCSCIVETLWIGSGLIFSKRSVFIDFWTSERHQCERKHWSVASHRHPDWMELATWLCALIRHKIGNLLVHRMMLDQLSHTSQGRIHRPLHYCCSLWCLHVSNIPIRTGFHCKQWFFVWMEEKPLRLSDNLWPNFSQLYNGGTTSVYLRELCEFVW